MIVNSSLHFAAPLYRPCPILQCTSHYQPRQSACHVAWRRLSGCRQRALVGVTAGVLLVHYEESPGMLPKPFKASLQDKKKKITANYLLFASVFISCHEGLRRHVVNTHGRVHRVTLRSRLNVRMSNLATGGKGCPASLIDFRRCNQSAFVVLVPKYQSSYSHKR